MRLRSRLSFLKGLAPSATTRPGLSGSSSGPPAGALGDPHGPLTPHAAIVPSGSRVILLVLPTGWPAYHSVRRPKTVCRSQHRGMGLGKVGCCRHCRTGPRADGHACPGSREHRAGGQQTTQSRALADG